MLNTVLFAAGGAVALPVLLVLWAWFIKSIGDRSFKFRRLEQPVLLTTGWLVIVGVLFGLLRLYEGAVLR